MPQLVAGDQDLLTPSWQAQKVADAIPGARYELAETRRFIRELAAESEQ